MYDGAKVMLDTYTRLFNRYSDSFRNNFRRGELYNNGLRGIDCRAEPIVQWEHGDKIKKFMRKVTN